MVTLTCKCRPWLGVLTSSWRMRDGVPRGRADAPEPKWEGKAQKGAYRANGLRCGTTVPSIVAPQSVRLTVFDVSFGMHTHRRHMETWSKPRSPDSVIPLSISPALSTITNEWRPPRNTRASLSEVADNVPAATLDSAGTNPPTDTISRLGLLHAPRPLISPKTEDGIDCCNVGSSEPEQRASWLRKQ